MLHAVIPRLKRNTKIAIYHETGQELKSCFDQLKMGNPLFHLGLYDPSSPENFAQYFDVFQIR